MSDAERDLREGRWQRLGPGRLPAASSCAGATVGVVGLGRIGGRYAEMVRGARRRGRLRGRSPKPEAERALGARRLELRRAAARPPTSSASTRPPAPETQHLIGAAELDLIGPAGVLVNTSRGSLVDDRRRSPRRCSDGRLGAAGPRRLRERAGGAAGAARGAALRAAAAHRLGDRSARATAMARLAAENAIAVLEGREPRSRVA